MTLPTLPSLPGLAWSRHKKPGFSTRVASHVSGREVRLPLMSYPLYEFEAVYGGLASSATPAFATLGASSLQSLMGFFLQLLGQAGVFLYTDPDDNTVSGQNIGVGDGTTQRFIVSRTLGGFSEPASYVTAVSNVYLNGIDQGAAGVNWQFTAPNMLAFAMPPGAGLAITATFTFAFQCRFLDDQLDFEEFMSALWKLDKLSFRSIKPNTSAAAAVVPSWYTPYALGGTNPCGFADFTTEGGINHYLWNGNTYSSALAWLAAAGGSYANSSGKYVTNASGLLASVAANALPFNHDTSGNPLGLLLEGASTNLLHPSNSFSSLNGVTAAQSAVGPDGSSNSAWLFQNGSGSNYFASYIAISGSSGTTYTMSVYAKAGSAGGWLCLCEVNSNAYGAYFNLNTGARGNVHSGCTASIAPAPNGYYRCSVTFTLAGTALWFCPIACSSNGEGNYGGAFTSASENMYIFGGQVEASPFATSYIPATSSSATRAADSLSLPWTATTFTARVKAAMSAEADNGRLLGAGSGGLLTEQSGPNAQTSNGTNTLSTGVNAWTASNIIVLGGSPSGRVLSANGNTAASDSHALVPSAPSDIYIGEESGGSNYGYGNYAQFGLWTVAATAAQAATNSGTA